MHACQSLSLSEPKRNLAQRTYLGLAWFSPRAYKLLHLWSGVIKDLDILLFPGSRGFLLLAVT